jgi:hypothetical protein
MLAKALLEWMQTVHPTMPNITLEREDLMDVIAYILSHKDMDVIAYILSHKDKERSDNQ